MRKEPTADPPGEELLICRGEDVTRAEIDQAIADGFVTLNEIKRRTRSGQGLCQGRTCGRLVARLIAARTGRDLAEIYPATRRMPVRPLQRPWRGCR